MGFGQLSYDVAHLLAGTVLLLSFLLLYQRRISAVISTFAAQGAALALAVAWQGWAQGAPGLYVTALVAATAKAVLIPLALRALVRRFGLHRSVEPALGIGAGLIVGVGLVALAILVVLPATTGAGALAREDLAMALSVVLLGMLMMITRRQAISQVIGLLSLENGLVLAAAGVRGLPLVVELSTAALVLVLAGMAGFFAFHLRASFASLDLSLLHRHRGERAEAERP
ncbi:hydrogenase-4 component E [Roseomonas sp. M0104]|uniref:Hydrogenase-4 component E n=1 Tax=Teichococcus coralli TaxID=2545983 RepID=A0A845BPS6_9PROT|nr:hydrogenase-4 component E [Pseudoroseomonas coralli]MXP65409.1 hydrogenase-4 component E [Pseudoroseomonas coralli]